MEYLHNIHYKGRHKTPYVRVFHIYDINFLRIWELIHNIIERIIVKSLKRRRFCKSRANSKRISVESTTRRVPLSLFLRSKGDDLRASLTMLIVRRQEIPSKYIHTSSRRTTVPPWKRLSVDDPWYRFDSALGQSVNAKLASCQRAVQ